MLRPVAAGWRKGGDAAPRPDCERRDRRSENCGIAPHFAAAQARCSVWSPRRTKPAPPLAIGQEQSGMTLEDLIGKQPELVGREGV